MSVIASFTRLPADAAEQLRLDYDAVVEQRGQPGASFDWSGYVLAALLPYLNEQGVALMDSSYDDLARQLSESRGATFFMFTPAHKESYFERLSPSHFSSDELRDYFNEFNATDEPEIGQAMLDGVAAIRQSLATLDAESVILLSIG